MNTEAKARMVEAALFIHDPAGMSWAQTGKGNRVVVSCGARFSIGSQRVATPGRRVTCPRCLEKIGASS